MTQQQSQYSKRCQRLEKDSAKAKWELNEQQIQQKWKLNTV